MYVCVGTKCFKSAFEFTFRCFIFAVIEVPISITWIGLLEVQCMCTIVQRLVPIPKRYVIVLRSHGIAAATAGIYNLTYLMKLFPRGLYLGLFR